MATQFVVNFQDGIGSGVAETARIDEQDMANPVTDGGVTHLIPVDTCAFLFGERSELRFLTNSLGLHP